MAKIRLNLSNTTKKYYTEKQHYENSYHYWRMFRSELNMPFIMVPAEIINYISSIRSKALSLYLYYCQKAGNTTGKSWHSIETIATALGVSTKSVNNWNAELEELGLIARVNEGHNSKTTYLLPISSYSYFEKKADPAEIVVVTHEQIDGKLIGIFHLFQWRKNAKNEYTIPYNVTCLVFQRRHSAEETNENKEEFLITKAILIEEDQYSHVYIDKKYEDFSDNVPSYFFSAEQKSYAPKVPVYGIALTSKINLKETKKSNEVIDLIEQLALALNEGTLENLPIAHVIEETEGQDT